VTTGGLPLSLSRSCPTIVIRDSYPVIFTLQCEALDSEVIEPECTS